MSRLETDIIDFATDENASRIPVMKMVNTIDQLEVGVSLDHAVNEVSNMVAALVTVREADIYFVRNGIETIVEYCNASNPIHADNVEALGHRLRQKGCTVVI